jgi:hypothetical protein
MFLKNSNGKNKGLFQMHEVKKGKRNIGILKGKSKVTFAKNFRLNQID